MNIDSINRSISWWIPNIQTLQTNQTINLKTMKKISTILAMLLIAVLTITAQPPQAFKYKAIARNKYGMLIINQQVAIRISILQGSETGPAMFIETHTPVSNLFGVIELEIGRGTPVSGAFSNIDWGTSDYYIKIEMDPKNKPVKDYTVIGTSQLLSVPYALYAGHVQNSDDTDTQLTEAEVDAMVDNNGYLTVEGDADPANEIQVLSLVNNMLTLTTDGTPIQIDLTPYQQKLSIDGNILSLSNGGSVILPNAITSGGQYYYLDKDGDGFGYRFAPSWVPTGVTEPDFFVSNSTDCNDENETINPSATENMYDGLDNDCDGEIDENLYPELNYTGKWRVETVDMQSCPYADITYFRIEQNGGNIKLYLPGISQPFSGSVVNGHDINISCYYSNSLTVVISGTFNDLNNFTGHINISSSCHTEGQFTLTALRTNDVDQDGYTEDEGDCNDYNETINPGATEVWGDGYDNDCDGVVDEYLYPELDYTGTWRITPVIDMQSCSSENISYFIIEQTGGFIKCYFPNITSQAFNGSVGNGHDVYIGGAYSTLSIIIRGTFTDSDNLTGTISFSSNCGLVGSFTFSAVRSIDTD
jgi:hypothetical protein